MISHYRTLGVDPQADPVVIRSAYLALMRRHHPDGGGAEADPARAKAVTAAWEVLRDPARRAAYDEGRMARFQPEAGGAAAMTRGPRVRGGAAGRNLFLLLAAGTVGLGWWGLQQPLPGADIVAVGGERAARPAGTSEPALRPAEDEQVAQVRVEEEVEEPRLPEVNREPQAAVPVVPPPLPQAEPVRLPVRSAEARPQGPLPAPKPDIQEVAPKRLADRQVVAAAAVQPAVDLAPLQRHLRLLTEQSLRFGTEAKRSRLFATSQAFQQRLRECESDACKRDTYLRRNTEVAEIMRGGG